MYLTPSRCHSGCYSRTLQLILVHLSSDLVSLKVTGDNVLLVAVAATLEEIDRDWQGARKLSADIADQLDNYDDIHTFITTKIHSILATQDTQSDETIVTSDTKLRNAARSYRSIFNLPETERLVSFYSCAYNQFQNQGWLYISENYCAFYAYVIGVETKVFIELKDIVELRKERTKRGLLNDGLRLVLADKTEHLFFNLFRRDEVHGLLEQLAGQTMHRMLKNASADAPGQAMKSPPSESDVSQASTTTKRTVSVNSTLKTASTNLKMNMDEKKRNTRFQELFHLPLDETLLEEVRTLFWCPENKQFGKFYGFLFLGANFMCFQAYNHHECSLVLPYSAVRRLERVNTVSMQVIAITVSTCHAMKYSFQIASENGVGDRVCDVLKDRLKSNIPMAKLVKPFIKEMASEVLLSGRDITVGGFGLEYGYVDFY